MLSGKISTFGGPDDSGVGTQETCALYTNTRCRLLGTRDYADLYCAMRWNYAATQYNLKCGRAAAIDFIRNAKIIVQFAGKTITLRPVDWGPAKATGRLIDVSPIALQLLGCHTDDTVQVAFDPLIALQP